MFIQSLVRDNIIGIAAQTAFFLMLSLFPLAAVTTTVLSRYSNVLDNDLIVYFLPDSVLAGLIPVIEEVGELSGAPLMSVLLTLWSGSAGIWALMRGVCRAYTGVYPEKAIFKRIAALLFVVVFLVVIAFGLSVWVLCSNLISRSDGVVSAIAYPVKYLGVFLGIFVFILSLYAYTPGYTLSKRQLLPGALAASIGWMLANTGFEIYIKHFKNYSLIYGSIGAFLGLLIWLFAISVVILTGAEINIAIIHFRSSNGPKEQC